MFWSILPMLGCLAALADEPGEPSTESAVLSTVPVVPGMVTPDTPHYDLEVMYDEAQYEEGYRIAKERLAADPDDIHLPIHVARFIFERGERIDRTDTTVDKKAMYEEMIAVVEDGLERHPDDPHLLFAYGIAKGRLGTTRGVLASLFMAKDVEQSWLAAANSDYAYSSLHGQERLPCDAHQALGIYYRIVPDWWIVKMLAGTRGDLSKGLWHLKEAERCAPDVIRTVKELGVTQMCIGDRNGNPDMVIKGQATLARVLALPPFTPTEELDVKHAQMLIDDPSLACEYSRDGQQDLDPEAIEGTEVAK